MPADRRHFADRNRPCIDVGQQQKGAKTKPGPWSRASTLRKTLTCVNPPVRISMIVSTRSAQAPAGPTMARDERNR